ncbi:MAG: hypothetical protein BRC40_09890 [Cyanobacteria bacterium QH_8_48_120]|nr:MAG: hypothetical protein BRC34_14870 [Cyanobacteria bacterium QH_1_48_107]PSO53359.1 MAG: hypothetical protein BRC35_16220 [Cyanobacteria bacterium QH_10_48_56]PSO57891.1 MAG: hypothetical protein BRC39_14090 [Cyanobacteria bacterium QH_7_48_89]PSO58538.1 MAG: hypothetical protein BRC36_17840 [Cyanobacteria bacterium QH_2_48_84]PSO65291.1 MAG: hypothetical protein BRC38_09285 [Cyanobacteria bacterium QH_6_48_35]PSO72502.1 MAG: hypothetical protein BRC40_09890 [Cyanobacteria bacterium QH_8_
MPTPRLNLRYKGFLGVLIEPKSPRLIPSVKPLPDALIDQAGFWVSDIMYNCVLQLADEYPVT